MCTIFLNDLLIIELIMQKYTADDLANIIIVGTKTIYEVIMLHVAFCVMFIVNLIISASLFALFYYFGLHKSGAVLAILVFSFILFATLITFLPKAEYCKYQNSTRISGFIVLPIMIFLILFSISMINIANTTAL
ncbi:hypothetical protein ABSA28_01138 [Candidatus Hepatincolaceae symbiont of Richtersius coronifer]